MIAIAVVIHMEAQFRLLCHTQTLHDKLGQFMIDKHDPLARKLFWLLRSQITSHAQTQNTIDDIAILLHDFVVKDFFNDNTKEWKC